MSNNTTISKSIFLNTSPENVWVYLTDKDKLGQWYHPAQSDLKDGQEYQLLMTADDGSIKPIVWGKVLKMDRPNELQTTFCIEPFHNTETILTWTLKAAAGGTRLSLEHKGIAEVTGPAAMQFLVALDAGWDKHFAGLREAI